MQKNSDKKVIDIVFAKYLKIKMQTERSEINFPALSEALKPNEWKSLEIINKELDGGSSTLKIVLGGRYVLEECYVGNIDLTYHKGCGNLTTYLRRLSIVTE